MDDMKSTEDIKKARNKIRKEVENLKKVKVELFPNNFKGTEDKQLLSQLYTAIQQLQTQDDALTFVLNEDSLLPDVAGRVKIELEDMLENMSAYNTPHCKCPICNK